MAKKKSGTGAGATSAGGEEIVQLDPSIIYFTFSRIRPCFSCGRTIESTTLQMQRGELKPTDLPLLSVFSSTGAAIAAASAPGQGDAKKKKNAAREAKGGEAEAASKGRRANKKGKRRGDDSSASDQSDTEDLVKDDDAARGRQRSGGGGGAGKKAAPRAGGASDAQAGTGPDGASALFYFSQNNRRLYMYKQLREMGVLETVPVRLKPLPQTRRMSQKYTPEKCALVATLQREGGAGGGGEGRGDRDGSHGSSEEEDDEEEEDGDGTRD